MDAIELSGIIDDDYWIFDLRVLKFRVGKTEEKIEIELTQI